MNGKFCDFFCSLDGHHYNVYVCIHLVVTNVRNSHLLTDVVKLSSSSLPIKLTLLLLIKYEMLSTVMLG